MNIQEDSLIFSEETYPGVFCTHTLVNKNNCHVKIINTTTKEIQLPENFCPKYESLANFYFCSIQNKTNEENLNERAKKLNKELKLESSEPLIRNKLDKLCNEFNDIFSLQGDLLSENNFYKQSITLNDPKPTYIKNYRLPESQKHKINEQVQKC